MDQESLPLLELVTLILFLGSITFILGAIFQSIVLFRNKATFIISLGVIIFTRLLTILSALFIWAYWVFPFDIMFLFLFLPALLPEIILSPLILKLFGNHLGQNKIRNTGSVF